MNCDEIDQVLDDFVAGDVTPDERDAVTAHLESCPACRAAAASVQRLFAQAKARLRPVEPEHDLWPGIAARIGGATPARQYSASRPALAAAAAVLLVAASVVGVRLAGRQTGGAVTRARVGRAGAATLASYEVVQTRATFATARRQLVAVFESRRRMMSPQTVAVVEKNMRVIDEAVREMEAALARDPGNAHLPALLVAAYDQEIDMLQGVAHMPQQG
jgi:anti-sigma factor RsiW